MGYPGDEWASPYGERPADTPPGPYGGGDPYRQGAAAAPSGHDPHRGYPPLNEPPADDGFDPDATRIGGPGLGAPQTPQTPQTPYGTPGPSGPYGPPASPYGDPSGHGYAPSGPQQPYAPSGPQQPYGPYGPSGPQQPQPPGWAPGPPPGGGFGPPGPPPGPPPGRSGGKTGLIIGGIIGAVVILGGGGTAVAVALNSGDDPAPKPTKTAAQPTASDTKPAPSPTSTVPSGRWKKIASRATDPKPLTLGEVFGRTRVSAHGRSYRQVKRDAATDCPAQVTGSRLRAALSAGDCTQILRATYLRGDGKVMGTVSISNLSTAPKSHTAFTAAAGGKQYVTPLKGPGRTARLGQGAALGIRQVRGHYLLLSWVQYADGHRPASSAGRKQLSAFHNDVVSATLARPLSYRLITGRPRN